MEPAVTFVGVVNDTIERGDHAYLIKERHYKTLWRFQNQYFVASAAYFAQDAEWGGISVNETFIYEANRKGDGIDGGITLAEYEWFIASHTQHRHWIEEAIMVKETSQ